MKDTIRKLIYILPERDPLKLLVIFFAMLILALIEVAGLGMIPAFVAIVANPERVLQIEWIQPLLQTLEIEGSRELLLWGGVFLVGIFVIKSAYVIGYTYFEAKFIYRRRYIISKRLMTSYMQAPYTFHLGRNTSELLRNITGEVNIVVNAIITTLLKISKEVIMTAAVLTFLLIAEPLITLLIMLLSGAGAGSFILFVRNRMKLYGLEEQVRRGAMIKAVQQGLAGIKDVRVLNRESEFIEVFRKEAYGSSKLMASLQFIKQVPKPIIETTAVIGMLCISLLLVWQGRPMSAIIPILTLFAMATVKLMPSIQTITSMYTNLRYNMVSINPVYDDLKELEEYNNRLLGDREKNIRLQLNSSINADSVRYRYPNSEEQAIDGVSFSIPKGAAAAFVGSSGAGKTTIIDLLLGLLEPESGAIRVDGNDIQNNLSAWQRNIGYIPQSIYLADETLRCNIAFGVPEKEIDDEKVQQAAELAQLGKMIQGLPDGLETIVGEQGTRLSGGQRQRVGIARALYHNPEVLVMDEATSALDNITEKQITAAIDSLKGDRTIIMIAHRLTTVKDCDIIYFMEDGKIVQSGTYRELIKANQHFREMALEV